MQRFSLLSIALFPLLGARDLAAQTFAGLGAGLTIPTGEVGRIDKPGYQLFGIWQSITPLKSTGFRIDGSFSAMKRKATIQEISERIVDLTVGPVIRFPRIAVRYGYVIATAGAYNHSLSPSPVGS